MEQVRFSREVSILERTQMPRSSFRDQIRKGLFTKPVKLSPRAAAWPAHEVEAILRARMAGKTDDEIRKLVAEFEAQRTQAANTGELAAA